MIQILEEWAQKENPMEESEKKQFTKEEGMIKKSGQLCQIQRGQI